MDWLRELTNAECFTYGFCTPLVVVGLAENTAIFLAACVVLGFIGLIYHWNVTT